jgi:hypothetical protein
LCKGDQEQCVENNLQDQSLLNDEYKESYLSFDLVFFVQLKGGGEGGVV